MKILMLVNWKIEYTDRVPEDKQPPDYFIKGKPYWFFRYFPNADDIELDVVDVRSFPWLERFEQNKIRFYVWQTLKCIPKLKRYDMVISHGMQSGIVLCLWRRLFGKRKYKHVVFDIGAFNSARESGRSLKLMQYASKSLDGVIYHTEGQRSYYEKCHPWLLDRSRYIPFGTDDVYFQETGIEPDRMNPYILCVGYHKRDWDTLLEAYAKLRDHWNESDGRLPVLRMIGKQMELDAKGVEMVPAIPIKQLIEQIQGASFCVLPLKSFNYSYGQMTLLQQMVLKKAVIVADVPSLRGYITDREDALVYEPENAGQLAELMRELVLSDELREKIAVKAQQAVRDKWNERVMATRISDFLVEVEKEQRK